MRRPVNTFTAISSHHGDLTGLGYFGKHLGCDYAGDEGRDVIAPVSGMITQSYLSTSIGNTYEIKEDGNGRLHRLCHLKSRLLGVGVHVSEGQVIGKSGGRVGTAYSGTATTGPHVHWDVRKPNTVWNASFDNYYDPEVLLTPPPATAKMPPVNSSVQFSDPRTAFVAGTTTVKGTLPPDVRIVRGYDPKYPNRIIVNSASVGNGVAVALYYVSGQIIPGWKSI